ncbi:MAG: STAS domain-containing protein [Gammaproteobacteria bacterium]|nr:STAS domain-containing protein [Gammaproteobacteria bacterium]
MDQDQLTKSDDSSEVSQLDLEGSLTIAEVSGLQETMLGMLNDGKAIKLSGGDVAQVDAAGLQLLAALMKEAVQRMTEVQWIEASAELRTAAAQLGLDSALQLDENV